MKTLTRFIYSAALVLMCIETNASAKQVTLDKAVTYSLTGRLGNNLIAYAHGKWIAEKYHIPLLYKEFKYSDQFAFHDIETYKYSVWKDTFAHNKILSSLKMMKNLESSTLIEVPYFRDEGPFMGKFKKTIFMTKWDDPKFRSLLKSLFQPRFPVKTVNLPNDKITVLSHVRRGGGFDSDAVKLRLFYKFPPDEFYISSIEKLSEMFDHAPMYVYIMTDDQNPQKILQEYSVALAHLTNVTLGCHSGESGPDNNVMEDFFSIGKFDCLIRGDSTFSIMGTLLGDFKAIITPKQGHVEDGKIIIDEVEIIQKKK